MNTTPDDKKKKLLIIGIICAVVIFAAAVVIAVILSNKKGGKKNSEEYAKIDSTLEELIIYNMNDIRESIPLPDGNSKYGTTIEWSADKDGIIDLKASDKIPAGVVHRQNSDTKITLTAKVSCGGVSKTKDFELTVKAKAGEIVTTDYLFATFKHDAGPGGQQIWFSTSNDGNHWKDINSDKMVLSVANATEGDKGVRDPYLVRSPEGDKFYLIATDLCIGDGQGTHTWGSAQSKLESSKYLRIWESVDLVNWSEPWLLKVGISTSSYTWAPEAIWDEESRQYMLYWSAGATKDANSGSSKEDSRTWYCMTRDFRTFTKPEVYASSVNEAGMIDMDIIHAGDNTYYRISSSYPDIMIEVSKNGLFGNWEKVTSLQELGFNYGAAGNETPGLIIVEGPEIFKYNEDDSLKDASGNPVDTWGVLVDNYGGKGYFPIVTTDLSNTVKVGEEGCVWSEPKYDFDSLKRHGTILPITADEYKAIMQKWGDGADVPNTPSNNEEGSDKPILVYDFESGNIDGKTVKDSGDGDDKAADATLKGNAAVEDGKLVLDGTNGTYLEFPKGFFDGMDTMTISMDVKSDLSSGNFFTFTYGKSSDMYSFMRVRGNNIYNAITTASWGSESSVATDDGVGSGEWQNVTIVVDNKKQSLYVNGVLKGTSDMKNKPSDLGSELLAYLGKSFYDGDIYFKGAFDNVKVYNKAFGQEEINGMFNVKSAAVYDITSDKQQFAWNLDEEEKRITLSFFKNGEHNSDLTKVALKFKLNSKASIKSLPETFDFTKENTVSIELDGETKEYKLTGGYGVNPVISGQYADPDIDYLNGKYYIYPTTDGFSGWGGYQFHCFSSDDMVNWTDEGKILDVKNSQKAGADNSNGIPGVPWAVGNAWAPSIEAKNGKYYFYFCAKRSDGVSCIGVAVADSPAGPYVAGDEPLLTPEICASEGKISGGQTIDPSIFTDDDGKSYMLFGNGYGAIVQLGEDMTSIVPGTMHKYTGTTDLRESIIVVKRNGVYHFTWSCDDTGSENYHVNYGISDSLYGNIQYKGTILSKDIESGILGTGHHSILYMKDKDEYYIAYHRFVTPIGRFKNDFGVHREVCVDKLTFDASTGLMNKVTPTHTGPLK